MTMRIAARWRLTTACDDRKHEFLVATTKKIFSVDAICRVLMICHEIFGGYHWACLYLVCRPQCLREFIWKNIMLIQRWGEMSNHSHSLLHWYASSSLFPTPYRDDERKSHSCWMIIFGKVRCLGWWGFIESEMLLGGVRLESRFWVSGQDCHLG